ncbi:protein CYCLOPS-like isoform X1 [Nicotiana tomentosiformis]|uniref:protein CYCLOPS-like isoform X1 n=1 Tax=Nicotiana tomentosiformis TaxID=4098 RepID=UPI00388CBDBF
MEMEGRGYSDLCRNTSEEELFIRNMMENSVGVPAPTMEMLGFRNISHSLRTDSEELFKTWLTTAENNGSDSTTMAHRARQGSRRISGELAGLSNQQYAGIQKRKVTDSLQPHNASSANESSSSLNQHSRRNITDTEMQASNLFLAKTWFHSSQPMTRSRSSELRRRYAAMQNSQSSLARESLHNIPGNAVNFKEVSDPTVFTDMSMCELTSQPNTFISPSNSSSSTFETQQVDGADNISSVVSMLKGTLERKKLTNYHTAREAIEENMLGCYGNQDNFGMNQHPGNHISENQGTYQDASIVQVRDTGILQMVQGSLDVVLEGIMAPSKSNPIQMCVVSQEPSQSESSVAAPIISTGFDACDGLSNASHALNVYEGSRNQVGYARSLENGSTARDLRERIYDNVKDNQKTPQKEGLVRNGSLTSVQSAENGDPTKKRRVERSRKMAEAKERNLTPAIPSDMQSLLKRCENLEKEVRSLKLNLAFMNRLRKLKSCRSRTRTWSKKKSAFLEKLRGSFQNLESFRLDSSTSTAKVTSVVF